MLVKYGRRGGLRFGRVRLNRWNPRMVRCRGWKSAGGLRSCQPLPYPNRTEKVIVRRAVRLDGIPRQKIPPGGAPRHGMQRPALPHPIKPQRGIPCGSIPQSRLLGSMATRRGFPYSSMRHGVMLHRGMAGCCLPGPSVKGACAVGSMAAGRCIPRCRRLPASACVAPGHPMTQHHGMQLHAATHCQCNVCADGSGRVRLPGFNAQFGAERGGASRYTLNATSVFSHFGRAGAVHVRRANSSGTARHSG